MRNEYTERFDALRDRFPYQFEECSGPIQQGWLHIFEQVCEDVDRFGGVEARVRWFAFSERDGKAYWGVKYRNKTRENIEALIELSERMQVHIDSTAHLCAVCGEPGAIDFTAERKLALCPTHNAQRIAGVELKFRIR